MPRTAKTEKRTLPALHPTLYGLTVEILKWYTATLPGQKPTHKGDLVALLSAQLSDPALLQARLDSMPTAQRQLVAEVVHALDGVYDEEIIDAKYPDAPQPAINKGYYRLYGSWGLGDKPVAQPFDLFFYRDERLEISFIPGDLAATLAALLPPPAPSEMKSSDQPPELQRKGQQIEVLVSETAGAVFHDLSATLDLTQQGKAAISAASRLPGLTTVRLLKERLLLSDYFPDEDYARAEDAIRPLALVMLAQAARWAAPNETGSRLELTRSGQDLFAATLDAAAVKLAWERWLKSDVLDELSRVRGIKGQQAKGVHLSKPSSRRETVAAVLRRLPPGRWVELTELLRYMRAERMLPQIERGTSRNLGAGYYSQSDSWEYRGAEYNTLVVGAYLRVVLLEYAATLGLLDVAYARAEDAPLQETTYGPPDPLGRYDGLLAVRLTSLGAYALGLARGYTPPAPAEPEPAQAPLLRVLPNMDIVIIDAARLTPNDRALLKRSAEQTSDVVYHLSREALLDSAETGLSLRQVRDFLATRSGQSEAELPQTVRVFFADLERRLDALREAGRVLLLEGDDPYLLTELSNEPTLRGLLRLTRLDDRPVLLVNAEDEAVVRRQLKKLGYLPRKEST